MDPDEQLYELAAKELASAPRQGLLIKSMTKAGGDEKKAKALYIQFRVDEMKAEIAVKQHEAEKPLRDKKAEERRKTQGVLVFVICGILFWVYIYSLQTR